MIRALFAAALLLGPLCHSARAQDDTEVTGLFYDVTTHEFLTLGRSAGRVQVRYSAGQKPFVTLLLLEQSQPDDEPGLRAVYTVAFPGSPQTRYVLNHWVNERAGIDCYDASGELLNQYSFITNQLPDRPCLVSLLYGMGTLYRGEADVTLTIDPTDETYAIRLTVGTVEHDLAVRSESLANNTIEFVNADAHGPFTVQLFKGIRYRSPGMVPDQIAVTLPGGVTFQLTARD